MISIIICSKTQNLNQAFSDNINNTIGTDYEIVLIDNSKNKHSICEAYNIGASKSKFEILCFVHDDVLFHTNNWGEIVIKHLNNKTVGALGIAGSIAKTKNPSPWWISGYTDMSHYYRMNILQHLEKEGVVKQYINPGEAKFSEVAVLDGVWLCCRKEMWQKIKFDQKTLKNFHFYDLDFSLAVLKAGHKNIVTYEVLLEHFSNGSLNAKWVKEANAFHKKWKSYLPKSIYTLKKKEKLLLERNAIINHLHTLVANKVDFFPGLKLWATLVIKESISRQTLSFLWQFLKHSKSFVKQT